MYNTPSTNNNLSSNNGSSFPRLLDELKIVIWNANGIMNKIQEFRDFVIDHNPIAILINETWLKPADSFSIPNYKFYRIDRLHAIHGGVGVLIKNYIHHTFLGTKTPKI